MPPGPPHDRFKLRFLREQEALGERVRSLRRKQGLTQEQAAEVCDIGVKELQRIEGCRANPRLRTLAKVAEGFDQSIGVLFGVESPKRVRPYRERPPRRRR